MNLGYYRDACGAQITSCTKKKKKAAAMSFQPNLMPVLSIVRMAIAGFFLAMLLFEAFFEKITAQIRGRNPNDHQSLPHKKPHENGLHNENGKPKTDTTKIDPRKDELVVNRVDYYVTRHGYLYEQHRAVTRDGFILQLHRIRSREAANEELKPVILQHGLFMDPGMFVTNEQHSLAFVLADQGFDVWLGSNRAVVLEHVRYQPSDDAFWNWSIDELAEHDVPTIIDYVLNTTHQPKVAWVGMSQGNGQAFMAFSVNEELASKISLFVAIAPVARIGQLPTWPLQRVSSFKPELRETLFGRGEFIPLLCLPSRYISPQVFHHLAYTMFYKLFRWSDRNWVKARKAKYFQFTPRPQSCKLINHWCEIALTCKLQRYSGIYGQAGETYPIENIKCPIAIFHGTSDYLADCNTLVDHLKKCNFDKLVDVELIDNYEHLDLVWASDSHVRVFTKLVELLKKEDIW